MQQPFPGHHHPQHSFRSQPRVNGDYAGQAPVTLSLNRHKPVHVAAVNRASFPRKKRFIRK